MSDSDGESSWVRIGAVIRPHGIRGELKLYLDNPDSELLKKGLCIRLVPAKRPAQTFTVAAVFGQGDRVRLEGLNDRNLAETWRQAVLEARREDFPPLAEDETYLVDLIGAEVRAEDESLLGVIDAFSDNRAQPLAEVKTPGGEVVSMPFVPGIVTDLDEEAGVVWVDPPEGLFFGEAEVADKAPPKKKRRRKKRPAAKAAPASETSGDEG